MPPALAYVEIGVAMAYDSGIAAWSYEPALWGRCGQGPDEPTALANLTPGPVTVAERVVGDEQAFGPDLRPATDAQRQATIEILTRARAETISLVAGATAEILDRDDPARTLPSFAGWRTLRQMAWHLADTESRYYLPSLGLPPRPRLPDLLDELAASGEHVRRVLATIPPDLRTDTAEVWTTTKLLRRLAWHEPAELATMQTLAAD
ncbi:MAG TPA: hypothetical protein VI357_10745 [Mycobacteriales bacterium]